MARRSGVSGRGGRLLSPFVGRAQQLAALQALLAQAELTSAIALYRALDMTFWLPQAEATLARVQSS
jgi:hypothetical protein